MGTTNFNGSRLVPLQTGTTLERMQWPDSTTRMEPANKTSLHMDIREPSTCHGCGRIRPDPLPRGRELEPCWKIGARLAAAYLYRAHTPGRGHLPLAPTELTPSQTVPTSYYLQIPASRSAQTPQATVSAYAHSLVFSSTYARIKTQMIGTGPFSRYPNPPPLQRDSLKCCFGNHLHLKLTPADTVVN